jgi:(R,R)-butanediol dehydrogenase / meso-butanediol dehydrogenase / diacetyl reductase
MKAAVYHGRRDVRIETVPDPGEPGPREALLRVSRAAICGTDASEYEHGPLMIPLTRRHPSSGHQGPLILGHEFVGRVVAVGPDVDEVHVGQRVVPGAGMWCGACELCKAGRPNLCARYYTLGLQASGGLAQFARVPVRMCRPVPDACTDDAAALAQPLAVAIHALRRSGAERGHAIVLIGIGGIGAFILAAATAQGHAPIIAVDVDDERLTTAWTLGATQVVNASVSDPVAVIHDLTDQHGAPIVIEASGAPSAPGTALAAVRRGGRVLVVGLQAEPRSLDLYNMTLREVEMTGTVAHVCDVDLPAALEILASSNLDGVVLDRVIPLDALVEEGLRPLAERTARGKIVVNPQA